MAGGHGGHGGMKHYLHIAMLVHGVSFLPASFIFFIYSIGTLILKGDWHFFLYSVIALVLAVILFVVIAIASE